METLNNIQKLLSQYPDGKVYFNDPVMVKSTPHVELFTCHGAWLGDGGVYLMDSEQKWHGPLQEKQVNATMVINSLYQRLKSLQCSKSTA